jgi:hypothetical protein
MYILSDFIDIEKNKYCVVSVKDLSDNIIYIGSANNIPPELLNRKIIGGKLLNENFREYYI